MRKLIFIGIFMLMQFALQAQLSDTIYAHENITTSLIFPGTISLADIGSPDYLFEYEGNLLIIKARRPSQGLTSLLVRFGENDYFTGYLGYDSKPSIFYYDYRKPVNTSSIPPAPVDKNETTPSSIDKVRARKQLRQIMQLPTERFKSASKQPQSLSAKLEVVRNSAKQTFIRVKVENLSSLPYKVEFAGLQIREDSDKKGLSGMVRDIAPIVSQIPTIIPPKQANHFAFGFDHFATSKQAKLILTIRESQGTRAIQLSIPGHYVLHAKSI